MRGVKRDNSVIFDGSQIYPNYVRSHSSLNGGTPTEAYGIEIKGKDKWKTLIQNVNKTYNN